MDRFLPAAQAVAVGSPQYTFRKASVAGSTGNSAREHAHAAAANWRMGSDDDRVRRTPVQLPYQHLPPNYLSCNYPRRDDHEEEEEEEDDDDFDVHSTRGFASKGCGLLPGLCVKTSLLLLNPMPIMKGGKARQGGRGRGLASKGRGQKAPSPLARSSQRKNLGCDSNGQYWEEVYKHKLEQKYINQGEDRRSKLTSESNHLTFWSDSQTGDGSSPFRHSIGGGMSPYRRDVALSPSRKANGSLEVRDKDEKMSRSNGSSSLGIDHDHGSLLGSDHSSLKGSSSMSSGVDRTLHEDSMDHRSGIDSEASQLTLPLDPKASLNSGCDVQHGGHQIVRSNSIVEVQDNDMLTKTIAKVPESISLIPSGNAGSVKLDDRKTHDSSQDVPVHSEDNIAVKKESMPLQFLMPLPVPKSPSDSWLSRNLPSVKNKPPAPSFLGIQVQSKKQAPWASTHPKENDLKPPRTRQIRFADRSSMLVNSMRMPVCILFALCCPRITIYDYVIQHDVLLCFGYTLHGLHPAEPQSPNTASRHRQATGSFIHPAPTYTQTQLSAAAAARAMEPEPDRGVSLLYPAPNPSHKPCLRAAKSTAFKREERRKHKEQKRERKRQENLALALAQ
uniref:Uncharacterized protein n=1 Tax=Aegilops tauschii TaxID=37682 RepID=R7W883_AEGTA